MMVPETNVLKGMDAESLWTLLDQLTNYRRMYGRGRSEEAAYVRHYCKAERRRIKEVLKRLCLPPSRPDAAMEGHAQWQGNLSWGG